VWAKEIPTKYFLNSNNATTLQYDDTNVADKFQWAAVELFISSLNLSYKNDINLSSINGNAPTWTYSSSLTLISIMHQEEFFANYFHLDETKNRVVNTVINYKHNIENNQVPMTLDSQNDYTWGSNSRAAHHIVLLTRAYEITKDISFLRAAYKGMDYILGNNNIGYLDITNFGTKQVLQLHHRVSRSDDITSPVPGMLASGPNLGEQDFLVGYCQYLNTAKASSYIDSWCSCASNEVAINWNATLTYALNTLQFCQNEGTLNLDNVAINKQQLLSIFPNPHEQFY
jgi:endoglucanase